MKHTDNVSRVPSAPIRDIRRRPLSLRPRGLVALRPPRELIEVVVPVVAPDGPAGSPSLPHSVTVGRGRCSRLAPGLPESPTPPGPAVDVGVTPFEELRKPTGS